MARAVVFHGPGQPLELASLSPPALHDGELLVRVLACTLCRSDLHSFTGRRSVATPTVLGHEIVGRIEAFGPSTSRVDLAGATAAIGDRITWSIVIGCGECYFCTHDLPQKCQQLFKYGHEAVAKDRPLGGGLADYCVLLPKTAWLRLPDSIPDEVAALANCAAATAAAVLRYAGALEGQRLAVIGAGVLGTIACAMAASAGASAVLAIDPQRPARERAMQFGAARAFDATDDNLAMAIKDATDGIGADVVLELAGNKPAAETGLAIVRTGGTMVLAGAVAPCGAPALDPEQIVRRMLTLRGVHNYHPRDLQTAVAFLGGPGARYPLASLATESYPLEGSVDAFAQAQETPGVRIVVRPGSSPA